MPQTLSAKKALRRDSRREAVNKLIRQKIKNVLNLARKKPSLKTLTSASSLLDRAAKRGIIHKNKAARLKSRLAKLIKKNPPTIKTLTRQKPKKQT